MSATENAVPVISLSEGFGAVVVQGDTIRVEISPEGHINVQTPGRVTTGLVSASASAESLKIGAKMPDGSIYAGVSPDTARPMYTTPEDARINKKRFEDSFHVAARYASKLDVHGHKDWRAPTRAELNVLFQNCATIGGFDTSARSFSKGNYWSSSRYDKDHAWAQCFTDGDEHATERYADFALRCVRG